MEIRPGETQVRPSRKRETTGACPFFGDFAKGLSLVASAVHSHPLLLASSGVGLPHTFICWDFLGSYGLQVESTGWAELVPPACTAAISPMVQIRGCPVHRKWRPRSSFLGCHIGGSTLHRLPWPGERSCTTRSGTESHRTAFCGPGLSWPPGTQD